MRGRPTAETEFAHESRATSVLRKLRPRSVFDIFSVIALLVALFGGTAMAAVIVSSNAEIATNTISGSNRPEGYANDNIVNKSVAANDLANNARAHRLQYFASAGTAEQVIATVGNVRISAQCKTQGVNTELFVYVTNVTTQTGAVNSFVTSQFQSSFNGPVDATTSSGEYIFAGEKHTVDSRDDNNNMFFASVANNQLARMEGQLIFDTPGLVTSIDFHASIATTTCALSGTGVPASLK